MVIFKVFFFFLKYIDMLAYTHKISGEIHKKLILRTTSSEGGWETIG